MSFLDKLKSGVSEAGAKAKVLVEINKLKLMNVSKQNEVNGIYKEIGEKVVLTAQSGQELRLAYFSSQLEQIEMLKTEIEQNQLKIINLSDEKQCSSCNRSNGIDAMRCTHCGGSFIVGEQIVIEQRYLDLPKGDKSGQGNE